MAAGSWRRCCPRFSERYPQLDVRLRLSDHLLDLVREAVDVAIRLAVPADSSLIARKIADCPRMLCAAPAYLEATARPRGRRTCSTTSASCCAFPARSNIAGRLRTPDGPEPFAVGGRLDADDGDMLTEWALLGQGIVAQAGLRGGGLSARRRLVPVLPDFPPEPVTLAVVYPHRKLLPAKVKAFADFAIEHLVRMVSIQVTI